MNKKSILLTILIIFILLLTGCSSGGSRNTDVTVIDINEIINQLTVTLSGSVTKNDGNITEVNISWGDSTCNTISSGFDCINESHTYSNTGNYTININAKDNKGKNTYESIDVTVDDITTNGFTYNGTTYMGKITDGSGNPDNYQDPNIIVTKPVTESFNADGFFEIEGIINYSDDYQYALINVEKTDTGEKTSYWVKDSFNKRIWLRFGSGEYKIYVHKTKITNSNTIDEPYDGDILGWIYYTPAIYKFTVTNIRNEDGTFYYPSDPIQSGNQQIHDKALDIIAGISDDYNKVKAVHDWVVKYLYYDDASLVDGDRKKQDALSVYDYETGVCEGYTSLFTALLRSIGFRVKAVMGTSEYGGCHAWNNVYYNLQWYSVDTTWDDPGPNDNDPAGNNLRYDYFMKEVGTFHTKENDRPQRFIVPVQSKWSGYPAGIY